MRSYKYALQISLQVPPGTCQFVPVTPVTIASHEMARQKLVAPSEVVCCHDPVQKDTKYKTIRIVPKRLARKNSCVISDRCTLLVGVASSCCIGLLHPFVDECCIGLLQKT